MNIRGIDQLDNETEWEIATGDFIMGFFNDPDANPTNGAFDVMADISVTDTSKPSLSQRRTRHVRERMMMTMRQLQDDEPKSLEITYTQRSIYKTTDAERYPPEYVATRPFETRDGIEDYIRTLKDLSPHYANVTSIGSVRVNPPLPPEQGIQPPEDEKDNTTMYIIIGVCCGVGLLLIIVGVFVYRRRQRMRDEENLETVGNGPETSMRQIEEDLENGSSSSESVSDASSDLSSMANEVAMATISGRNTEDNALITGSDLLSDAGTGSEIMLHVFAPAGKLGVIVDTPPSGGPAYVCEIKDSCPIADQIRLEDKIIAVDDEDVQTMTAVNVSKLLARRARNPQRKITVLREAGVEPGQSASSAGASSSVTSTETGDAAAATAAATAGAASAASSSILPMTENPIAEPTAEEEKLDLIAPAGKLGVVLVTPEPPEFGPSYVFNIRDDSPLKGKVQLGDRVIAVDDEDVRDMTAINVSKLLGSKSNNDERKITVLRQIGGGAAAASAASSGGSSGGDDQDDGSEGTASSGDSFQEESDQQAAESPSAASSSMMAMTSNPEVEGSRKKPPAQPTERKLEIIAPAGKLGVVVDSPPEGGSAYVSDIKEESPLRGEINLGDRIISVDGEDVSKLKAIHVSMLLGSKSRNPKRTIEVLREVHDDFDDE